MTNKLKGTICGVLSAIFYGTNPVGALVLYADGFNSSSVLFYRFSIATLLLGALLLAQRKSFRITRKEFCIISVLGLLFAVSALSLYMSFHFMAAGIASTLLFVYPVMVAVLMALFFREKVTPTTVVSILLSLVGVALLYRGDGQSTLSLVGVILVLVSSLTYAFYIIVVNQSSLRMSSVKLTFYVLFVCTLAIVAWSFVSPENHLMMLHTPWHWFMGFWMAIFPTVLSLVLMVLAVHDIGSTPTAIMGALEPVTAVFIGIFLFGEAFSLRLAAGILLILVAVLLIILGKHLRFRPMLFRLRKYWRWRY